MTKRIPLSFLTVISFVAITACDKNMGDHDDIVNQTYELSGTASGSQIQPPTGSNGTASIAGTYNVHTNLLNYHIAWSNLLSAAISAGFHTKTVNSHTSAGISWNFSSNNKAPSGNHYGMVTLTAEQEAQLLANEFYYVINTTGHTDGEISGQVTTRLRK